MVHFTKLSSFLILALLGLSLLIALSNATGEEKEDDDDDVAEVSVSDFLDDLGRETNCMPPQGKKKQCASGTTKCCPKSQSGDPIKCCSKRIGCPATYSPANGMPCP